jgi:hypothetical protein
MHDYFNEHKPEGSNRSQIAIQHRWALIQKAMNKFCGHKEATDRMNESRKNEQDQAYFHSCYPPSLSFPYIFSNRFNLYLHL